MIITALTLASLMGALYFLSTTIFMRGFEDVEQESVVRNVKRASDAMDEDISTLGNLTRDWASWDDTYAFIEDRNLVYIASNLEQDTSYANNEVNLMVYVNASGEVMFAKGYDLIDQVEGPVPESIFQHISPEDPLLSFPDPASGNSGILMLPEGPMLVAAQPILTSEQTGPARGTLIWGRWLNEAQVARLAEVTHLSLAVERRDNGELPADFVQASPGLTVDNPIAVQTLDDDVVAGYTYLDDIYGQPALIIRVDLPRNIYAQGEATTDYFLFSLLGVGLVFGIVIWLLLQRLVLARVARLSGEMSAITADSDHSGRVSDGGSDELAIMAASINTMLDALDKAQKKLKDARDLLGIRVQERTAELSALYELSRSLSDVAHSYDTILNMVTSHAVKTIRVTFARVALLENDGFVIEAAYPIRPLGHDLSVGENTPLVSLPFCDQVMRQNEPVVVSEDAGELTSIERQILFLDFTKTLCLVPLRSGNRPLGLLMLGEARQEEREPFTPEKISLARSIGEQVSSALKRAELFLELERSYLQTVLALANAVDAKDTYTADHGQRLAEMAMAVGRQAGMSADELRNLQYGAILHDVGKIGVPDSILLKPGKLDSQEWIRMRQHPEIGAQILSSVPHLAGAAAVVLGHHERYDGSGYPQGLRGDDIPLGARILAIIDAYNAIIDKRVYKEARSHEDAIAELKRCASSQFDPGLTEMFIKMMQRNAIRREGDDSREEIAG